MFKKIREFGMDESGATAIEYGLIAALVSVAAIAALRGMGESLSNLFGMVSGEISGVVNTASQNTSPTP
jgi:pilus assembly protein Flp/PilA